MNKKKKIWLSIAAGILFPVICIGIQMLMQMFVLVDENAAVQTEAIVQPNMDLPADTSVPDTLSEVKLFENDRIVCYEDRIFKRLSLEENQAENVAQIVGAMNAFLPSGTDVYVLPVPERVLWEEGYEEDIATYTKHMNRLRSLLGGTAVLTDAYASLSAHAQEELFFNTEDSWNMKGAFYGVLPFCKQTGIEPIAFEDYVRNANVGRFKGNLLLLPELAHIDFRGWPDDELVYYDLPEGINRAHIITEQGEKRVEIKKPLLTFSSRNTSSVLAGDYIRAIVPGDACAENKKDEYLLFLCDGEGKLLLPYLKNYYKGVYVVKITCKSGLEFDIARVVREYNVKDVLIAQSVSELGKTGHFAAVSEMVDAVRAESTEQEGTSDANDIP